MFFKNDVIRMVYSVPSRLFSSPCHVPEQSLKKVRPFDEIPGPSGRYSIPFIGQVFHYEPFGQYLPSTFTDFLRDLHCQYGQIVRQRAGMDWMVFLFNPVDIQQIMFHYEKYPLRPTPHLMYSYAKRKNVPLSMAFLNKEKWVEARKPIQEVILKPYVVSKYFSEFTDIVDDFLMCRIDRDNRIADVLEELTRLTMENSGILCFNRRLGSFSHDRQELLSNIKDVHAYLGQSFDIFPWYCLFPTNFYLDFERAYDTVRNTTRQSLNECLETINFKRGMISRGLQDFTFLEKLILDHRMTHDSVESAITDMFIAGTDATANALSFVLYHLAKNPLVQDRLYEEITRCCTNGLICESSFADMPYLKACIKESLRLVPPLRDGVRRHVEKDTVVAGFHIPKGTTLVFCNSIISSDKNYFPEAHEYKPERWLRNSPLRRNIHPFAVLPYGFGRRNCIGQRFADLQMRIFIVKLLQNFSLSLAEKEEQLPYKYTIFAAPSKKFSLQLEKRIKRQDDVRCVAKG
ncbi:probable cytochrome P450 49a1 [Saccostrea echinata]|uniref:probable cytochrome P450 49a1 n=1 Tax=Saccostrea echinata TaxID=191078 RepID=UPI002A82A953|nr:probable cytochrome P450 49a1 [Saccostrea echinata]